MPADKYESDIIVRFEHLQLWAKGLGLCLTAEDECFMTKVVKYRNKAESNPGDSFKTLDEVSAFLSGYEEAVCAWLPEKDFIKYSIEIS